MGAARVFGPQKGADPDTVAVLEQRLTEWAAELDAAAGRHVSDEPGAGAAGGLGAALLALGGRRESGAAVIAEHTRLADDVAARRSGHHRRGPVRRPVAARQGGQRAGSRGAAVHPVLVLAGQVTLDDAALREAGIAAAYSITDYAGSVQLAIDDAAQPAHGAGRRRHGGDQDVGNSGRTRYR